MFKRIVWWELLSKNSTLHKEYSFPGTLFYFLALLDLLHSFFRNNLSCKRSLYILLWRKGISFLTLFAYFYATLSNCYAYDPYAEVIEGHYIPHAIQSNANLVRLDEAFQVNSHQNDWVFRVAQTKELGGIMFVAYERVEGGFAERFTDTVNFNENNKQSFAFEKTFRSTTNSLHFFIGWDGSLRVKSAQAPQQKLALQSFGPIVIEDSLQVQELVTIAPQVINHAADCKIGRWDVFTSLQNTMGIDLIPALYNSANSKLTLKEFHLHQGRAQNEGSLYFEPGGLANLHNNILVNSHKIKGKGNLAFTEVGSIESKSNSSIKLSKGTLSINGKTFEDEISSVL